MKTLLGTEAHHFGTFSNKNTRKHHTMFVPKLYEKSSSNHGRVRKEPPGAKRAFSLKYNYNV